MTSPNDTVITGGSIIDSASNTWSITTGGQVWVDGRVDATTKNVIELAYVNGAVWQENSSRQWWGERQPNAHWVPVPVTLTSWAPASGTSTSPLPPTPIPERPTPSRNDTFIQGDTGSLIDSAGNTWTITTGGQVATNGAIDTTTKNVIELAYVDDTIWQENSSQLWWGKTSPTASWSPSAAPAPLPTSAPTGRLLMASPNDTVIKGGSIIDSAGNTWSITVFGQVYVDGTVDTTTKNVIELAYVNGTIWQENTSQLWWVKTSPTASWSPGAGPASPWGRGLLVRDPIPASGNDTVVLGSTASITDGFDNTWTITTGGQVAVDGMIDATTANVVELAHVSGEVWQENASGLWWGKTSQIAPWSPAAGTAISPLPPPDTIAATQASATVSQTQVSINTTSGDHLVNITGTGDTVNLSGGNDTITDTYGNNTYILPAAGNGTDTFSSDILTTADTLDLKTALAATDWNGSTSTLANYLTVADSATGAILSVAATSGGSGVMIATIDGANTASLTDLLAHSIT
jgi:hypothetical protein